MQKGTKLIIIIIKIPISWSISITICLNASSSNFLFSDFDIPSYGVISPTVASAKSWHKHIDDNNDLLTLGSVIINDNIAIRYIWSATDSGNFTLWYSYCYDINNDIDNDNDIDFEL